MSHQQKIRLLIVSQYMTDGGAERFASVLLSRLDQKKYDLNLCLMRGPITYSIPEYVKIFCLNKTKFWHWPRTILRLRMIVRDLSPCVILSTVALMNVLTGVTLLTLSTRPKWIQFVCAVPKSDPVFTYLLSAHLYSHSDYVVSASAALENMLREKHPEIATRSSVILTPIDCQHMNDLSSISTRGIIPEKTRPTIISVGRLVTVKRPDLLIDVISIVRRTHDVDLWLCGEGALRGKLMEKVSALSLDAHVVFLGFQDNPFSIMKQADIFVLSSDNEGLPNSLMEAQAMGLPAVSTDCPTGPNEIVQDGVTGLLTPVGSPRAMAEAICHLLEHSEIRNKMGQKAAIRARRLFDFSQAVGKWEEIIARVNSVR